MFVQATYLTFLTPIVQDFKLIAIHFKLIKTTFSKLQLTNPQNIQNKRYEHFCVDRDYKLSHKNSETKQLM